MIDCINTGVNLGEFGFGKLVNGKPEYVRWKENCPVAIESGEILINPEKIDPPSPEGEDKVKDGEDTKTICGSCGKEFTPDGNDECPKCTLEPPEQKQKHLIINTNLPQSTSSSFSEVILWINQCFKTIQIHIDCEDGEISDRNIERIKEALTRMGASHNIE